VFGQSAGLYPDEVEPGRQCREGAAYQVTVNAYERDREARKKCLAHYGPTCVVCGFNFGVVYGRLAEGFIHVHHLKPLSEIREEYRVDPIADLRPVCPNCHAIIHLGGGCRKIEEARRLVDPRVLAFWASFAEPVAAAAWPRD
jgi:predicted HNH restriction endonuclease